MTDDRTTVELPFSHEEFLRKSQADFLAKQVFDQCVTQQGTLAAYAEGAIRNALLAVMVERDKAQKWAADRNRVVAFLTGAQNDMRDELDTARAEVARLREALAEARALLSRASIETAVSRIDAALSAPQAAEPRGCPIPGACAGVPAIAAAVEAMRQRCERIVMAEINDWRGTVGSLNRILDAIRALKEADHG